MSDAAQGDTRILYSDTNVVINLTHIARLDLFGRLTGYEVVVPDHVRQELTREDQRRALDDAVARGYCRIESITNLEALQVFAELRTVIGSGEAACLVLAERTGGIVLSDEKRRFRREVEWRIGLERLMGTADLFLLAIRSGLISVEEADRYKETLEQNRFRMPFASFRDLIS